MLLHGKCWMMLAAAAMTLIGTAVQAGVIYGDDFNRGYWNQSLGNTSIGNYPWKDTDSDVNRIYEDSLTILGGGGYDATYVQYNLDGYSSYKVEFDFKVAAGLGTPPSFYFSPRGGADDSVWDNCWSVQNVNDTLILMFDGAGVSSNAGLAGEWIHVVFDVAETTATLHFGSLVTDIRATVGTANDNNADYARFSYYWSGDYGLSNWKIDNLSVTPEPATMILLGLGGLITLRKKVA